MHFYSAHIYNTSPFKEKFWRPRGYKILQKYTYAQVITFLKPYLSKYKSNIYIMCNFYKLTNHNYTNCTQFLDREICTDALYYSC